MGVEKEHRPLLAPYGLQVSGASTFTAALSLSTGAYVTDHIQTLTGAASISSLTTGTRITNYGVTKISWTSTQSTAADYRFVLSPPVAGVTKTIYAWPSAASTKTLTVITPTSAATFMGTTSNSVVWSTKAAVHPEKAVLVGMSTTQWAVTLSGSTVTTIAGATA